MIILHNEVISAKPYANNIQGFLHPQLLYNCYYNGFVSNMPGTKTYIWSIDLPFEIIDGQGTTGVTCQLTPVLSTNREEIIMDKYKNIRYRNYKFAELNLQIINSTKVGKWKETLNLYYTQGPLWKLQGNIYPTIKKSKDGKVIKSIETYTLIPIYDQIGHPPKNSTDPNSYSFKLDNGSVTNFYGDIPPKGNPKVDIFWNQTGSTYLTFYSAWTNDKLLFANTFNIYVSEQKIN